MEAIELRYRYRLRVNTRRRALLDQTWAACRMVWNTALGRWEDLYRHEGISIRGVEMAAELTDWRGRYDWLRAVPVTPQQQTIRSLDKAIAAYFDRSNPAGRPRFKRKGTCHTAEWNTNGFRVTGTGQRGDRLSLALPGGREEIPVVWSRPLPSEPKSVQVYRCPEGHYWASFVVRVEPEPVDVPDRNTGLDVGLNTLVATSHDDDSDVPNPRFSRADRKLLRRVDQRAGRGRRDQRPSEKTKRRRARAHGRVARRRLDYHQKTARQIARSYREIGVEDLRIRNMLANRHLSRAIADAGWGQWVACLEHQRRKIGRTIEYRDPRNTSQTCSECGTKAKSRLGLADRVFVCEECGMVLGRDRNAARNLEPGRQEVVPAGMSPPSGGRAGGAATACKSVDPCEGSGSQSTRIPRL